MDDIGSGPVGRSLPSDNGRLPVDRERILRPGHDVYSQELDAFRIENKAPWVSLALQGYEGTQQILFSVESVTSNQGEEAAAIFKKDLTIRGGGVLLYPLENDAKPGVYKVSVRLTNPGYSHVLRDAMTIIVE